MRMSVKKVAGAVLIAAALGAAGCASNKKMDSLSDDVRQATEAANRAAASAEAARAEAAEAKRIAQQALEAAREANQRSKDNSEKIDRMFKKSMQK